MPPASEIDEDAAAAYAAAMQDIYGGEGDSEPSENEVPGMHRTETVDVMTVLDGEVYAVLEDGETLLRKGDTTIQRGTRQAGSNRSDRPVTVITTMLPAKRGS